jgi:hypothetical protein
MPKSRPVQILKTDEPWMYITLADGTVIKHKLVIMGVIQILDDNGNPFVDQTGCCCYAIQTHSCQIIDQSPMIEERTVNSGTAKGLN